MPPAIKVVTLRAADYDTPAPSSPQPKDWSCRWFVREHVRRVPTADGETKLVRVHAYVKGPADKPLKTERTVYTVDR